jgi:Tfp pilus assembly protein PilX
VARPFQHARERGFGLVETLIATAIIAAMMAMMFEGISLNARATTAMIDRRRAVLIAKSALDTAVIARSGLAPSRGVSGTMQWQIAVEPYQPSTGNAPALELITVTVVRAGTTRPLLRLRSLRLSL